MILLYPGLIKFQSDEEKARFKPQYARGGPGRCLTNTGRCHMFYSRRVVDIPDGLPKWSGMSDKSDLIEDSPPEDVKKRKREQEEGKSEDGERKAAKNS